jgi:hypothetical protein
VGQAASHRCAADAATCTQPSKDERLRAVGGPGLGYGTAMKILFSAPDAYVHKDHGAPWDRNMLTGKLHAGRRRRLTFGCRAPSWWRCSICWAAYRTVSSISVPCGSAYMRRRTTPWPRRRRPWWSWPRCPCRRALCSRAWRQSFWRFCGRHADVQRHRAATAPRTKRGRGGWIYSASGHASAAAYDACASASAWWLWGGARGKSAASLYSGAAYYIMTRVTLVEQTHV